MEEFHILLEVVLEVYGLDFEELFEKIIFNKIFYYIIYNMPRRKTNYRTSISPWTDNTS
jgi:hypothetical protein